MRAPRKRRSRITRYFLSALGVFLFVAAIGSAGLFTLLREDNVTALAKEQIAKLAGEGYETNINAASLSFFRNGVASVEIQGISVFNLETNAPLLRRGDASFSVSVSNLLFGKIALKQISIKNAEMQIPSISNENASKTGSVYDEDGLVDPVLVSVLFDRVAGTVSQRLQANPDLIIQASNTNLVFGQGISAHTVTIERLAASKGAIDEFVFDAAIFGESWKTNLRGAVGATSGASTPYRAYIDPIPFSRTFTPQLPDLKPRNCVGFVGFSVASANGITSADASLKDAKCTFGALGDYSIDSTINGKLKQNSGIFEIGKGVITVNRSIFNFEGALAPARYTPRPEVNGEPPRYRYELVFKPSTMDSVDNKDGPLPLEGKISGTYTPSERRLAFDEFIADANGSDVRGAASLLFNDVTPAVYLALTSDKMPVKDFKRIWPRFAAPTPRLIVMERVNDGIIRNLRLELQLPPGQIGSKRSLSREQLLGSGDIESGGFITFGDLPPVKNAVGKVKFDGVAVEIQLEKGVVVLPSGREAKLTNSSFLIADTHIRPVKAELKVDVSGTAEAIAEIAAQQPVNAFKGQDIAPGDISGNAQAKAVFQLALVARGQKAPTPKYEVEVDVSDLALAKAINGQKISGGAGTIKANNAQVEIKLDANLNGLPAKITIIEPQGEPKKRKQDVVLTLTDAARNAVAPGLKSILTGPVTARLQGNSASSSVELDLTKAMLRIVPFNWEKGAGVSAKANFDLEQNGSKLSISNLKISGRGLEASGSAQIADGALQSAELKSVRLNAGDNFSLTLKKQGGGFRAQIGGKQLDARALMKQLLPGRGPQKKLSSQAISVIGNIDRLVGFNNEVVLNADIGFTPGKNSALTLGGGFENGGSIEMSFAGGQSGRLIIQTGNAGAALRFADLYKRMTGGVLATNFTVGANDSLTGPISISDFSVIGEPRLAKLANEQARGSASLSEATQADLAGERTNFELAQGDVVLDRGTIRLQNGIVRGANVGATAEGVVLSATGKMDLRGTFMPARGLNRIVGSIPILGLLLGSGSKAGLIGITYQLAGDAKNPKVFVNPISMIAPGVFRQIFE